MVTRSCQGERAEHGHRPRSRVLYLPAGEQLQPEETNRDNGDAEWEEKMFLNLKRAVYVS